jgi:hypothetical protein
VHFDLWSILVFIKRVVPKILNGVRKEEKLHAKKWYKKELI